MRIICCLMVLCLLIAGGGFAEGKKDLVPENLQQDYSLEDFTMSLGSEWMTENVESTEGNELFVASTIDRMDTFSISLTEEGGAERAVEIAAINDYSVGAVRSGTETINGIYMTFAAMEDPKAVYGYFSVNDHVYTASLRSLNEETTVEALQQKLYNILKTITLNIAE